MSYFLLIKHPKKKLYLMFYIGCENKYYDMYYII